MLIYQKSKSNNLTSVKEKLPVFFIPSFICINAIDFKDDNKNSLELILSLFQCNLLAIRSSAADEDGQSNSAAGEYESVLNVPSYDQKK